MGVRLKLVRAGTVRLADLLDEAQARAAALIEAKNPDLTADEKTALQPPSLWLR
ncbi:arginine--tRNA ligase domain-containing protein [Vibrio metschnikovii]